MNLKTLLILTILGVAAYYAFYVKGLNPFATKIDGNITLYSLDGKTTTLNDLAGKNGTFIFYMTTWCSVCVEELKQAETLSEFFRKKDINVVLCIGGGDRDEIHNWKYKRDVPWDWKTVYWQEELRTQFKIKKNAVPHLTVRDKKGVLVFSNAGGFYSDQLADIALKMLDNGK